MGITGLEMVATEVWAHKHINHSNKFQLDATHRLENHGSLPIWLTAFLLGYGVYFSWRRFSEVTKSSGTIGNGTHFSRKVDLGIIAYLYITCDVNMPAVDIDQFWPNWFDESDDWQQHAATLYVFRSLVCNFLKSVCFEPWLIMLFPDFGLPSCRSHWPCHWAPVLLGSAMIRCAVVGLEDIFLWNVDEFYVTWINNDECIEVHQGYRKCRKRI